MKVKECMCTQVSCVNPDVKIKDVAKLMLNNHIGCVPVCDNNKQVVGLVTDRDLILRTVATEKDIAQTPVSEVMTTKVYNISPEADIQEASELMCDCQIRRIPVVDNNTIVGIITIGDLANTNSVATTQVGNTVEGVCKCGHHAKNNQ